MNVVFHWRSSLIFMYGRIVELHDYIMYHCYNESFQLEKSKMSVLIPDSLNGVPLRLLSYNIDGLNDSTDELYERISLVIGIVISENPDIIFFQEVVPPILVLLVSTFVRQGYKCSETTSSVKSLGSYFTLTFMKTSVTGLNSIQFQRIPFSSKDSLSYQGRDILLTTLQFKASCEKEKESVRETIQTFHFLNCHLESCGTAFRSNESMIRQAQFRELLSRMQSFYTEKGEAAVIAGDLNIRDSEANYVLKQFNVDKIEDIALSGQKKLRITEEINSKKRNSSSAGTSYSAASSAPSTWFMPNKPAVQCRFDRCYYYKDPSSISFSGYRLIGNDEVLDDSTTCGYRTPSDHRGLVIDFRLGTFPTEVNSHTSLPIQPMKEKPLEKEDIQPSAKKKPKYDVIDLT
jgi:exonuclease III